MTERDPDPLYDALRDRLADYGQEPPAPLWASIRAQLPPPVAAPVLRRRTRRRAALALLALLLLVGLGTWQWWQPGGWAAAPIAATRPVPAAKPPIQIATVELPGPVRDTLIQPHTAAALAHHAGAAGGVVARSSNNPMAPVAGRTINLAPRRSPAATAATTAARLRALAGTRATAAGTEVVGAAGQPASSSETSRALAKLGRAVAVAVVVARPGVARANGPAASMRPGSARAALIRQQKAARADAQLVVQGSSEQQVAATLATTAREVPGLAAGPDRAAWQLTQPRIAALLLLPVSAPVCRPAADTVRPLPLVATRRWAVQVLAGPALSTRTLGSAQLGNAVSSINYPPTVFNPTRTMVSTGSVGNERATAGFGAEGQLQRQLNGRWSLSTGLGYHAYATTQVINVRVVYDSPATSNYRPDSMGMLRVRDTYHFLTVPLRVSYQLGSRSLRLRYGLRAGADVAFYLGGRSAEGVRIESTSRSWGTSGSPYRPFSLALSLGAEVRYQLAPGWELLAQPTLTHFATSVARPASGYVPRYPLAATALVGVAYWLR